jgi:hypothetical protein
MTSTIKVDNIQDQDGNNIINESANTITIGASGDTVTLASGASQSGFGRAGTVDWDTTVKTSAFTAVSGNGYFVNTTSAAITVTLPSSPSALDIVAFKDYALTFDTNNLILDPGSNKIEGDTTDMTVNTEGRSLTLIYLDSTQGWKVVNDGNSTAGSQAAYVTATGGTVVTCGDFKTHIFTSPGTFCVSNAGNSNGSNTVEYFVVAGGGGGGRGAPADSAGGGGAGGFRLRTSLSPASPLNAPANLPIAASPYPITVGSGGAGSVNGCSSGSKGSNSIFSSITSAGGGGGEFGAPPTDPSPANGGSGGGTHQQAAGAGNTPPVSPPQGNPGGSSGPNPDGSSPQTPNGGGGGGASAAGGGASAPTGGTGGDGSFIPTSFVGPTSPSYGQSGPAGRYFSGGGGGGNSPTRGGQGNSSGGLGGGKGTDTSGTTNTGGGGGGSSDTASAGSGGSGIVMIRYKFQN